VDQRRGRGKEKERRVSGVAVRFGAKGERSFNEESLSDREVSGRSEGERIRRRGREKGNVGWG